MEVYKITSICPVLGPPAGAGILAGYHQEETSFYHQDFRNNQLFLEHNFFPSEARTPHNRYPAACGFISSLLWGPEKIGEAGGAGPSLPICHLKKLRLSKGKGGPGHLVAKGAGMRLRPQGRERVPGAGTCLES